MIFSQASPLFRVVLCATLGLTLLSACGEEVRERRIVSLSPSATEILYEIGAVDQIIAVDNMSNYPADARAKVDERLVAINPNIEDVMHHKPDLVVLNDGTVGAPDKGIAAQLRKRGVEVFVESAPRNLDEVYAEFRNLGVLTRRQADAEWTVGKLRQVVQKVVASIPSGMPERRYYHEIDTSYYSASSRTFVGSLYALFNLQNIADDFDIRGRGYPKLTSKQIISADPEFVFLADTRCCGQNMQTVRARKGWERISAVRDGRIVELEDDIASRWGPRLVTFLQKVADVIRRKG